MPGHPYARLDHDGEAGRNSCLVETAVEEGLSKSIAALGSVEHEDHEGTVGHSQHSQAEAPLGVHIRVGLGQVYDVALRRRGRCSLHGQDHWSMVLEEAVLDRPTEVHLEEAALDKDAHTVEEHRRRAGVGIVRLGMAEGRSWDGSSTTR